MIFKHLVKEWIYSQLHICACLKNFGSNDHPGLIEYLLYKNKKKEKVEIDILY